MTVFQSKDLYGYLTQLVKQAVVDYLECEQITLDATQLPIDLRISAQASFGDYSLPVMAWARKIKRSPLQIAEGLATILRNTVSPAIREITATKPGYLNFRLHQPQVGKEIIECVAEAGADFGQQDLGLGTKVIVEHTNINSNKAAHVGHLRNACVGDTVVRMLRSQGYQVEADNYIDDSGVQVADVVVGFTLLQQGLLHLPDGDEQRSDELFDYYCSRVYTNVSRIYDDKDSELGQLALKLRTRALSAIEHGTVTEQGPDYPAMAADLSRRIVEAHLKTMARLNVSYDLLPWESAILRAGLWHRTFEALKEQNLLEKPEAGNAVGCWILPFGDGEVQTQEGDRSSDKILVRSDGTATYTAKDIAYQLWKFGLTDQFGVEFRFIPWGIQHDGRKLWTMRSPHLSEGTAQHSPLRTRTSAGLDIRISGRGLDEQGDSPEQFLSEGSEIVEEAPASRFGHAKRVINVIDVRQSYLQQVVYESLRRLGYTEQADNSVHLAYEVVALSASTAAKLGIDTSDGCEHYAMSGRKGIEIKADDLINAAIQRMHEVRKQYEKPDISDETAALLAASAIRYFMIRFNLQQTIALDMDEVLRPNGDTGVYLQYAYARANSILRRLQETQYEIPELLVNLPKQLEQSEWDLLRHIDAYPRRLAEATEQLAPPLLAAYAYDLAAHFSDFYEHTPPIVKETNSEIKAFRALLVQTTAQTMNNALRVLGLEPLERI